MNARLWTKAIMSDVFAMCQQGGFACKHDRDQGTIKVLDGEHIVVDALQKDAAENWIARYDASYFQEAVNDEA